MARLGGWGGVSVAGLGDPSLMEPRLQGASTAPLPCPWPHMDLPAQDGAETPLEGSPEAEVRVGGAGDPPRTTAGGSQGTPMLEEGGHPWMGM